jgi:hypothetical protein
MVKQLENDVLEEFTKAIEDFPGSRHDDLTNFFVYIFEFVQNNADICKILLGPDGDNLFLTRLKEIISQSQPPTINTLNDRSAKYWMPFAISGCVGTIQQWLDDGMTIPPKEIAAFIMNVMAKGVLIVCGSEPPTHTD